MFINSTIYWAKNVNRVINCRLLKYSNLHCFVLPAQFHSEILHFYECLQMLLLWKEQKKKHFNSKVEENYIEPGAHNWTMSSGGALLPTNVDRTLRFYTSNVNLTKVEKQSLNDWTTGYLGNWLILFPSNLACEQVYLSKFRENFPRTSKNEPACMLPRIGGDSGATNLLFLSRP